MSDATTADTTAEANEHGHEPTPRQYVEIAAALSILTLMEFSTYFIDFGAFAVPMLLTLMAIKFATIVGYFMHLKFDTRLFTRFMLTGLLGAMALYGIVLVVVAEVPNGIPG